MLEFLLLFNFHHQGFPFLGTRKIKNDGSVSQVFRLDAYFSPSHVFINAMACSELAVIP
jgi:hypothetical protein